MSKLDELTNCDVEIWLEFAEIEGTLRKGSGDSYILSGPATCRFYEKDVRQISNHKHHKIIVVKNKGKAFIL
uniref:Uncharacterized protein n=1 Tax=viral metagenome TaxID=1070528 RepID=A0A6M3M8I9_9ZZZZ